MQTRPRVVLKRQGKHGIESGHPWVYSSEIEYVKGKFAPGDIVDVFSCRQQFLGRGYINPRSQIAVRILSRNPETIDREFFVRRLSAKRETFRIKHRSKWEILDSPTD